MSGRNAQPLIQAENIIKTYGAMNALNGVSLDIYQGDVVLIVGPSGSGKSTFLRCLNLLEVPTSGHIYFEGTDITDKKVDINAHRQKMGMVFQLFHLRRSETEDRNCPGALHESGCDAV